MVYRAALAQEKRIEAKQQAFALELGNLIRHKFDLIYVDEASFNSYLHKEKTWAYVDTAVNIPINSRRFSKTVIASIGNCLKDGYCLTLNDRTDAAAFMEHLEALKAALRKPDSKPTLVLDNASAHHAQAN